PRRLDAYSPRLNKYDSIHLRWRGRHMVGIQGSAETESRMMDADGRIRQRTIARPSLFGTRAVRFKDAFQYDEQGRLIRHDLPEGGALHYAWHGRALAAVHWQDTQGSMHVVLDSSAEQAGYRHGNGLQVSTAARAGRHVDTLHLSRGKETLWQQRRQYDSAGRISVDEHLFPQSARHEQYQYHHDQRSRLQAAHVQIRSAETPPQVASQWWMAWHADGRLAAYRQDGRTVQPSISRDPAGLPATVGRADAVGHYQLHYGAARRLEKISTDDGTAIAEYVHNAFGHRIAKHYDGNTVHFLYLDNTLVAEARTSAANGPPVITRRYLYAGATPVGLIDYEADATSRLYAIHADLSGMP